MRQPLVVGNWKMNGSAASAEALAVDVIAGLGSDCVADVAVCPSYIYIPSVAAAVKASPLSIGAQNVSDQLSGAYTGEI